LGLLADGFAGLRCAPGSSKKWRARNERAKTILATLTFARKYDVNVGDKVMWWMGTVPQ